MRISNKRNTLQTTYTLHGHQLEVVDSGKYLGVTISQDLQNLGRCKPSVKNTAYCALIRPSIEYAATVWDPHQTTLIKVIDRVQRKAARFVYNQYTDTSPGCVTGLLDQLQWDPLQYRRIKQRLVLCYILYKIQNKLVEIQPAIYYTSGDNRTRGGHRLRQIRATKEVYKNSFFPRSIRDWNLLPDTVAAAPTLEEFRARLASVPWTQMQPN
ncbi:Hypothetical predicted protein [Mytilus galloprovincialis]|uniref:Uncharacterized protein n=1 Tax=Mytilus galloprovincialis TaxID=29158 RepID=A0A8B6G9P1_MYTGA|nr:Hypothetical predicted protein [Mytilus galloprovincialis]